MKRLLVVLILAACSQDHQLPGDAGGRLVFDVGSITFRVTSGAARVETAGLGLFLTDQPDACLAISQIPIGASTILALHVAAKTDGTAAATVATSAATVPAPGQAIGAIETATGGTRTGGYTAADGQVAWTAHADGTVTLDGLDVGFAGAGGRVALAGYTIPACP